jgi:hypothetical protein
LEAYAGVRPVAKRLVGGCAAAAKRYYLSAAEAEGVSGCVLQDDILAYNAKRSIVIANYLLVFIISAHSLFSCG